MSLTYSAGASPCLSARLHVSARRSFQAAGLRRLLTTITVCMAMTSVSPVFAGDACKTVLCMYGKFTGNSGGSACSSAVQDYFSIVAKKHGKINWGKTSTLRGEFLNSCPGADGVINKKINDKFGKVMG